MNRIILLGCIIIPALFSGSCKKSTPAGLDTAGIRGEWELRTTQASIAPAKIYAPGNGNKLTFTSTTYQSYANGQLVKSGHYILVTDTSAICSFEASGPARTRIVYDNDYSHASTDILVAGNKLSFASGCFAVDGGSIQVYEKLSQ